jgi:uncharacterized protein involved in outer membrane biogenesis
MNMNKRVFKIAYKTILWILGIWLGLLLLLEIVLSPSVASKIVHSIADEYIEGDMNFTKVRVSMFKRFPSLYVEIDDFSLTYPADRYDEIEKAGAQGWLSAQGRGEVCDTLASFKSFKASVRLIALLTGDIRIPYLNLDKPRIFAHSYNDGQANWNIIKMDSEEEEAPEVEEDDDSFLSISLGKISLTDHPHIVFTDSRDTLFALLRMKKMELEGKIANRHIDKNKIGLQIDSLIVSGRIGSDTLAFNMQNLSIR